MLSYREVQRRKNDGQSQWVTSHQAREAIGMVLDLSAWNLSDNPRHTAVLYDLHALAASAQKRQSRAGGRKADHDDSGAHTNINADTGASFRCSVINAGAT
jgi:hypothetical protein